MNHQVQTIPASPVAPSERGGGSQILRKTRKLSRVFTLGVPALVAETVNNSAKSPTWSVASSPAPGKRKLSVGKGFLRIPSIPDMSRVTRRQRSFTSPPLSPMSPENLAMPATTAPSPAKRSISLSDKLSFAHDSKRRSHPYPSAPASESRPSSFALSSRQIRRTSLGKLPGHLDENISPSHPPLSARSLVSSSSRISQTDFDGSRKSVEISSLETNFNLLDERPGSALKRSHSLWTSSRCKKTESSADEFHQRYQSNFGTDEEIRERQRALKVKRARKMSKVFGEDLPPALINSISEDTDRLLTHTDGCRDSIATLISVSTAYLLSRDPTPTASRISIISANSEAYDTAPEGEDTKEADITLRTSSAPFSDVSNSSSSSKPAHRTSISSIQSTSTTAFQERRRRNAKLSRFFGVESQDIPHSSDSIVTIPDYAPVLCSPSNIVSEEDGGPAHFWGFMDGRGQVREADMVDVVQKLRNLRAA